MKSTDFTQRLKSCGKLTDDDLRNKIKLLEKKIVKLVADKNRIVTPKDAFGRSLPILISALVLGVGYKAASKLSDHYEYQALIRKIGPNRYPNISLQELRDVVRSFEKYEWASR